MSGSGAPTLSIHAPGVRVGIIASSWHVEVMDALISAAQTTCASSGATSEVIRVPGSY
jgi:6,7-dimethyl-8-ribityllumazine synthase